MPPVRTAARCLRNCALLGSALAFEERAVSTKKIARTVYIYPTYKSFLANQEVNIMHKYPYTHYLEALHSSADPHL